MSTIIYARTAQVRAPDAAGAGGAVYRERHVTASPGRVTIRSLRNGAPEPGYDIRTRFPAFTAWRVGWALRRDGYARHV